MLLKLNCSGGREESLIKVMEKKKRGSREESERKSQVGKKEE